MKYFQSVFGCHVTTFWVSKNSLQNLCFKSRVENLHFFMFSKSSSLLRIVRFNFLADMSETVWENQAVTSNIFWQENISFLLSRRQSCHKGILVEGYQAQSLRPSNISAVHSSIQCMQAQWASRASLHELQNNQPYTYFGR